MFPDELVDGEQEGACTRSSSISHPGGTDGEFAGKITWNFNKFLIGRDGRTIARFGTKEEPGADEVIEAVEAALGP
jgi:glutathione peroxidase-family protein